MQRNVNKVRPYEFADLNRLEEENPLTRPVTTQDVITIINSFKNKVPGISGIGKRILKELPRVAIERFAMLTNLMISVGYYSAMFKNGLLVFTQKPGKDPKLSENYRPITLLEVPGKIIERILDNRLRRFCIKNYLFIIHQYGFRRGLGTDIAIALAYEKNSNKSMGEATLQCYLQRCGKGLRPCMGRRSTVQNSPNGNARYPPEITMQLCFKQNCANKDWWFCWTKIWTECRSAAREYSLPNSLHILYKWYSIANTWRELQRSLCGWRHSGNRI